MTSAEHRAWFEENIAWFESIPHSDLDAPVPACPGWRVDDVLNHLAYGLGIGYSLAVAAPPDADPATVFADLRPPSEVPRGANARQNFCNHMWACAHGFAALDGDTPCWTYAGPGIAAFWFRRAAIESWLHRVDVAKALGQSERLDDRRAANAIEETMSDSPCLTRPVGLGTGDTEVTMTGIGHDVLLALWGRGETQIDIGGETAQVDEWLGLVEMAFAGR